MKEYLKDLTAIIAMLSIAAVLIACITHDIDHGIIYTGITIISGLGGYTVGRIITEKAQTKK